MESSFFSPTKNPACGRVVGLRVRLLPHALLQQESLAPTGGYEGDSIPGNNFGVFIQGMRQAVKRTRNV